MIRLIPHTRSWELCFVEASPHQTNFTICSRSPSLGGADLGSGFWDPPLFCASVAPYLPLEIKAALPQGKKIGFWRLPGASCWVDLNYICVCVCMCACSTQREIWDMSSSGACLGLFFAGKPGQSWRGSSSTAPAPPSPWNSDACWQGHLQALSGRWPVAAADTHCLWATSRLYL